MVQQPLSVGTRVRATIDLGGIIRPFVRVGEPGRVEAIAAGGGYVVRFDAYDRPMGVHADEVARADAAPAR